MSNFESEETTRVDVPKPAHKAGKGADLCPVPATEGGVGDVSGYVGSGEVVSVFSVKPEVKRPQGRPTKLTPEFQAELFSMIAKGAPTKTSLRKLGVDGSLISKWRAVEREGNSPELTEFFVHLDRAKAEGELFLLDIAMQGDLRNWSEGPSKSAKWALERIYGVDYAPRVGIKLEQLGDLTLGAIEQVCGAKDCGCYAEIIAAISAIETSSGEAV